MFERIHHVSILASSEKSIEFYEKLGFEVSFRKNRKNDSIILLDGYGMQIEMFIDPSHPKRANNPENLGLRHFALKTESIERTISELDKKGIECGQVGLDWTGVKYCYTEDPDGLPIELHE